MIFRITSIAERELAEALEYYKGIEHSLAVRFLREFEQLRDRILAFPESGHPKGAYKITIIRGYPYCVAYTVEGDAIIVEIPAIKAAFRSS